MMPTAEEFKLVRNALTEALRNGKSEPLYMNYKTIWLLIKIWCEEYCIKEPRWSYLLRNDTSYYFDPKDFIYVKETEASKFVIYSTYKEQVQKLKQNLDKLLQKIDQEYDKLHPIEGWNSEYDEFME